MNYYEELGLSTGASEEEIAKSYQALSQILHPDTQPEAMLRKLAKAQMKRLNEVVGTLCDEELRANYDLRLAPQKKSGFFEGQTERGNLAIWAAIMGITCLLGYAVFHSLPAEPEFLKVETEVGPLILSSPDRRSKQGGSSPIEPVLTITSARAAHKVDGTWVYASDPHNRPARWTQPVESVELKLEEQGQVLTGDFRSRFKTPDKAPYRELAFSFSGLANGEILRMERWKIARPNPVESAAGQPDASELEDH